MGSEEQSAQGSRFKVADSGAEASAKSETRRNNMTNDLRVTWGSNLWDFGSVRIFFKAGCEATWGLSVECRGDDVAESSSSCSTSMIAWYSEF
ncbi:hypothetical protein SNOG_12525 [Parastagonospora nodorum SN15]|uniref:Uncharacterized protein n=1 Tax=Phaeosphaeria nodorum (strain SN15 / ATCC MYA-4574 / FGSC 10173) TaxID=321614 RepID=Q0U6T9_PHANO|nr:hypothetical protein SNOG_12525 [Parastagonospora nodorum SN15]EAT80338.1 hypothetical protein SNOG_12525 [Parastagonospora nodorum SN15]